MYSINHKRALAFVLCAITTSTNMQEPLYAAYARADGYGVLATTIAVSCYVLGILPVLIALGGLSDRIGRRNVMMISLLLCTCGTLLLLIYPHTVALGGARFLLGLGSALLSSTASVFMMELFKSDEASRGVNWAAASTCLGFGLGPGLSSLCLMFQNPTLTPVSFYIVLASFGLAFFLLQQIPETLRPGNSNKTPMLSLPCFNARVLWYGCALALCWGTNGLILSIVPAMLEQHGLSHYAGWVSMLAMSSGFLFQPMARTFAPKRSTQIGIMILLPSFALLAWGSIYGVLLAVLVSAFFASSAGYGFVYLGGLAGVNEDTSRERNARATSAFFLMGYVGFCVPVIFVGLLMDWYGTHIALAFFGGFLLIGVLLLLTTAYKITFKKDELLVE